MRMSTRPSAGHRTGSTLNARATRRLATVVARVSVCLAMPWLVLSMTGLASAASPTGGASRVPSHPGSHAAQPSGATPSSASTPEAMTSAAEAQLYELAPYAVQIVNLAMLDPVTAAQLVPATWLDSLAENALALAAEQPEPRQSGEAPKAWPIGPWSSPESLAGMIQQLEPRAVAGLYQALRPRLRGHCQQYKAPLEQCESAIRASVGRLSAAAVHDRALGRPAAPLTATQSELARLGAPVTLVLRKKLREFAHVLWGKPAAPID